MDKKYAYIKAYAKNLQPKTKTLSVIGTAILSAMTLILPAAGQARAAALRAGGALSMKNAFSYALRHNRMIKMEKIKLETAGYEKNEAFSAFLPRVDFNEIYTNTNNPLYAFGSVLNQKILNYQNVQGYFSPNFLDNPGMVHNYESVFSVQEPIFMGGKIYLGYKRARLNERSAGKSLTEAKQKVLFGVAKSYYSVILAKKYVNLMKSVVKTAGAYKTLAENMYKAGQVVSSDVLRAKVELASMKEKLASAEKNYRLAKYFLNINMGMPVDSEYILTGSIKDSPYRGVLSIAALQKKAFLLRPDYKALLLNKKNMKLGIKAADGTFLPNVVAGYDYFSNGPAIHPGGSYSYALSVMLNFNIFSGFYDYDSLQKSKSAYHTMIEYQGLFRNKIEMQVRKAYLQYKTDYLNAGVARLAAKNARETLKITTNRYKAGMTTLVNLDRTLDEYKAAKASYMNALYNMNVDKYYIKLVTGSIGR